METARRLETGKKAGRTGDMITESLNFWKLEISIKVKC